jgi:hypothetical protein
MERSAEEIVKEVFEMVKKLYGDTVEGLPELKWESIPEPVRHRIEHPKLTAFQLAAILVVLCPGLIVAPALSTIGFSGIGPVAGMFIPMELNITGINPMQEVLLRHSSQRTEPPTPSVYYRALR